MSLTRKGSQIFLHDFPVLGLPDSDRAVKYFSLNPFLPDTRHRCPLACAYCVCHQDKQWHHHPEHFADQPVPADLLSALLAEIQATPEGRQGFPISLCDYSDPFLPVHRERVLAILNALIDREATNMVYITSKVHPGARFLERLKTTLERPNALRVTIFVSLPPLHARYEPVSVDGRVWLLQDLVQLGIPCCWYVRPLVEEWYNEDLMWSLARRLLPHVAEHVILSGIVMSDEVAESLAARNLVVPAWDRASAGKKQPLSPAFEARLRSILRSVADELGVNLGPIMGHRLCGTNGNHAYGCLICGKQDRYCQLFQLHHYGDTVSSADNQRLKELLRARARQMRDQARAAPSAPEPC